MSNYSDRGMIKWQGFFIPEHKTRIEELYNELEYIEKPDTDDQELELLNQELVEAIEHRKVVKISFYKRHCIYTVSGTIKKYDQVLQTIDILDLSGYLNRLPLSDIIGLEASAHTPK